MQLNFQKVLEEIFLEKGLVNEVLIDKSIAFCFAALKEVLDKREFGFFIRAVYRPGGNGIVKRHQRTIKEAVFWYNILPRTGQKEE